MPPVLVAILSGLVAAYALLAGAAALGFLAARRGSPPSAPAEWPSVTLVPVRDEDAGRLRDAVQSCAYPTDRIAVARPDGPVPGDVTLTLPAAADAPPTWPRSMVRQSRADAPVVMGPTLVEHDDLFLPRLEALQHLGRLTLLGGAAQLGLPLGPGTANRALDAKSRAPGSTSPEASVPPAPLAPAAAAFNSEPEAAVTRPPADSFVDLLRNQAEWFRQAIRAPSRFVQAQAVGLWLVHAALLACCAAALALPAWRQPTLLALLGKMGADVVLTLPAASHFGQRQLLRSTVATVLMLVLSIPLAGGWALVAPSRGRQAGRNAHDETRAS
ncbi:hypothetical protein [Salinibacter ruber]|uniref:hypothetical protein n=1 Tax=Salinibacter ruber TaxID=146919 RepID=UPI002169DA05|nr:hypothetical protein [Salinibacter ruber]MCS4050083.1 hypothetical protein [Salinibacter ruber]